MFETEFHPEMLLPWPALGITRGTCADETCDAEHWRISLGWLAWSVHYSF